MVVGCSKRCSRWWQVYADRHDVHAVKMFGETGEE